MNTQSNSEALPPTTGSPSSAEEVCPNCDNLRYIQDAGFACCSVCNPNNSFYTKNPNPNPPGEITPLDDTEIEGWAAGILDRVPKESPENSEVSHKK
jgi:hypothetical protein